MRAVSRMLHTGTTPGPLPEYRRIPSRRPAAFPGGVGGGAPHRPRRGRGRRGRPGRPAQPAAPPPPPPARKGGRRAKRGPPLPPPGGPSRGAPTRRKGSAWLGRLQRRAGTGGEPHRRPVGRERAGSPRRRSTVAASRPKDTTSSERRRCGAAALLPFLPVLPGPRPTGPALPRPLTPETGRARGSHPLGHLVICRPARGGGGAAGFGDRTHRRGLFRIGQMGPRDRGTRSGRRAA
mgnify:CR=1 FL=1